MAVCVTFLICVGAEDVFVKYDDVTVDTQGTPYDYASVMHYNSHAFSGNGLPTIETVEPFAMIGQRTRMSPIDIQEVRLFYNCQTTGVTYPTTKITPLLEWRNV